MTRLQEEPLPPAAPNKPPVIPPQEFPDKQELHRNMLGLLGNVAEVRALRPQLLTPQFITVFT